MLEMKVKTVTTDTGGGFTVFLTDSEGKKVLPIVVGPFEAQAIAFPLQGQEPPRPLTHDLMKNLCLELGGVLKKIVITDIIDNTFYALIYLDLKGKDISMDARPSDAIALALRFNAPIYMTLKMIEFTFNYEDIFKEKGDGEDDEEEGGPTQH